MKNIIRIFRDDLKDIFSNISVLILLIGLAILPSLYAWFNIKASWDPYANTSQISVAVVNNDQGTTVFEKEVNVGNELIKKLKNNKSLGWQFVNYEQAKKGLETGQYYASIEIPKDFSKNISSILTKDITKAQINYTVNEKLNAVAPKITDKGASSIQQQVNQAVVETASKTVFEVLNETGITLEDKLPTLRGIENSLKDVQSKLNKVDSILDKAEDASYKVDEIVKVLKDNMPLIKTTLDNSMGLSTDVQVFLENTKGSMNDIAPTIKNDLRIINDLSSSIGGEAENLMTLIQQNYEKAPEVVNNLYNKVNNLLETSSTLVKFLTQLNNITQGTGLEDTISNVSSMTKDLEYAKNILSSIKNQIDSGNTPDVNKLNDAITVLNNVNQISGNLLNNFDTKIVNQLNNIFDKGITVSSDVITLLKTAEDKLPQVNDLLNTVTDFSGDANQAIAYIREKMPEAKSALNNLISTLSKVDNSKEMTDLINFLKNDVVTESNFIKEPVELVKNQLYSVENYGSAMTPFYTVLSLWVGMLILTSILTTDVHGDYRPYEVYFGRGLTFLLITLLQALVVSLGDLYILGVTATNPGLFVCISLLISLVFTFIVYSLVSVFGNIGKALSIILLVIQVAGSGGTFPIQVTPRFFQIVNPFLPFTYGIGALRETIGGIYQRNLINDILALVAFLLIFILLGVVLKKPINKITHKFTEKVRGSRLMEH